MKKDIVLIADEKGELLKFLYEKLSNIPRGKVKSFLEHRQISVNGIVTTKFNFAIKQGDTVKITTAEGTKETRGIEIIYEDEEFLAVNKPAKLLSVATEKERERCAYSILRENRKGDLFVLHRLDRDTSGVLVFAKKRNIREQMQADWNERVTVREYLAICEGTFEKKSGRCESFISENRVHVMFSGREGKLAITDYEVMRENGEYSLVRVNLRTGRKNQIRVHMKDLGHPVVGDKKYGATQNPIGRLGLHASRLGFTHPITGKEVIITAKPERKFTLPK
ncbi:MAG: RluA family pseudouridine synthase [Oscillospiraceae bacterium]|nr:RluA family pseudouridine synthase [Oscillospiraceae bacterium]